MASLTVSRSPCPPELLLLLVFLPCNFFDTDELNLPSVSMPTKGSARALKAGCPVVLVIPSCVARDRRELGQPGGKSSSSAAAFAGSLSQNYKVAASS